MRIGLLTKKKINISCNENIFSVILTTKTNVLKKMKANKSLCTDIDHKKT